MVVLNLAKSISRLLLEKKQTGHQKGKKGQMCISSTQSDFCISSIIVNYLRIKTMVCVIIFDPVKDRPICMYLLTVVLSEVTGTCYLASHSQTLYYRENCYINGWHYRQRAVLHQSIHRYTQHTQLSAIIFLGNKF